MEGSLVSEVLSFSVPCPARTSGLTISLASRRLLTGVGIGSLGRMAECSPSVMRNSSDLFRGLVSLPVLPLFESFRRRVDADIGSLDQTEVCLPLGTPGFSARQPPLVYFPSRASHRR